jgi:ribosomal protein L37E
VDHDQIMDEIAARLTEQSAAWRARWPHACARCGGWGGRTRFSASRWEQDDFDLCEALPEVVCHRCGRPGLNEGEGPCRHCGWNYDDGDPAASA